MMLVNRRREIPEKAFLLVLLLTMGLIVEVGEVTTFRPYPATKPVKEWWRDTRINNWMYYPAGIGIRWGMSQEEVYQIELPLLGEPKFKDENTLFYEQGQQFTVESLTYRFKEGKLAEIEFRRREFGGPFDQYISDDDWDIRTTGDTVRLKRQGRLPILSSPWYTEVIYRPATENNE